MDDSDRSRELSSEDGCGMWPSLAEAVGSNIQVGTEPCQTESPTAGGQLESTPEPAGGPPAGAPR